MAASVLLVSITLIFSETSNQFLERMFAHALIRVLVGKQITQHTGFQREVVGLTQSHQQDFSRLVNRIFQTDQGIEVFDRANSVTNRLHCLIF